ncbi:LOW QUALITY PROTEIN: hypothetical protein ACG7TL_008714 [Trametes sanguinea]
MPENRDTQSPSASRAGQTLTDARDTVSSHDTIHLAHIHNDEFSTRKRRPPHWAVDQLAEHELPSQTSILNTLINLLDMVDELSNAAIGDPTDTGAPPVLRTPPPRTPTPIQSSGVTSSHSSDVSPSQSGADAEPSSSVNNAKLGVPALQFLPQDASPVGKKSFHDSTQFASIQFPTISKKRRDVLIAMRGKTVLLSFEEFMKLCVPAPQDEPEPLQHYHAVDFSAVPNKIESEMYEPLMTALNQDWLFPHDVAVSTPHKADPNVQSKQKIDGGIYRRNDAPHDSTRWSSIELSIECKTEPTQLDPFEDNSSGPEPRSIRRQDVLGQIMCYSVLVFDNQHRTHHFTLLILGSMARIIRWDRSGLLVTHKFDYTEEPWRLLQFLWRFSRMTPAQRGHDPTAERIVPGSADYILMHARAEQLITAENGEVVGDHARILFKQSLFSKAPAQDPSQDPVVAEPAPLWRLRVPHSDGFREFLVGLPHTTAGSLAGRGTRTYVALDSADKSGPFVYLKDAWRVAHEGIEQEGTILAALNDNSGEGPVMAVPTLRCHGDVGDQVTLTQEIWKRLHPGVNPEQCPLKTHRHYRLVVNEVCLPMREFRSFSELVGLIGTCMKAHGQAYKRKGFLHRDISAGNVLILPKEEMIKGRFRRYRVGILADWELAKKVKEPEESDAPRQIDRTGTWQFASAMALDNPTKRIVVEDDMESFFHLILYFALRFLPHNCKNVGEYMEIYFDGHQQYDGIYIGGKEKLVSMQSGRLTTSRGTSLKFFVPGRPTPAVTPNTSSSNSKSPDEAGGAVSSGPSAAASDPPSNARGGSKPSSGGALPGSANVRSQQLGIVEKSGEPHPINNFLAAFLKRIRAHYTLHYGSQDKDATETPRNDPWEHAIPLIEDTIDSLLDMLHDSDSEPMSESHDTSGASPTRRSETTSVSPGPSITRPAVLEHSSHGQDQDVAALAAELGNHQTMIKLIAKHLPSWPAFVDRVPDQLPPNYRRGYDTTLGTTFGTKRTADTAQLNSQAPSSKRSRSAR